MAQPLAERRLSTWAAGLLFQLTGQPPMRMDPSVSPDEPDRRYVPVRIQWPSSTKARAKFLLERSAGDRRGKQLDRAIAQQAERAEHTKLPMGKECQQQSPRDGTWIIRR